MFNYNPWRQGREGKEAKRGGSFRESERRTVTQIAEETFCLKSDLAVKRLRIAQNDRPFFSRMDLSERRHIAFRFKFERAASREHKHGFTAIKSVLWRSHAG